jgi:hypothetical protein
LKWVAGTENLPKFQVKNLNLTASALGHNLDLIKITGEKLFAFNEVELGYTNSGGIRDEAAFLFTRLTTLRMRNEDQTDALAIKKTIENYQKLGQLKCISFQLPKYVCLDCQKLGRAIISLIDKLSLNTVIICNERPTGYLLKKIFLYGGEKDAYGRLVPDTTPWTALSELVLYDCELIGIDEQGLADLFPRLENLYLRQSNYCLTMLKIFKSDDPFRRMNNMRVLKLENMAVKSFTMLDGGCMPHLEELYVKIGYDKDSPLHIKHFPRFPKLTKLDLSLENVFWIDAKVFDHLTQLTHFKIDCGSSFDSTFETGVAARYMSFDVACKVLNLTSKSISNCEEMQISLYNYKETPRLETSAALSELKRLTLSNWADMDLPFHQMTNLEYVSLETNDLSIVSGGQLRCLTKLRTLEVKNTTFFGESFNDLSIY